MRLIDADAMKEMILKVMKKQDGKDNDLVPIKELQIFIDNQPTAYDVDKVVKQLTKNTHCYYPSIDHYCVSESVTKLKDAIEIVRAGGTE